MPRKKGGRLWADTFDAVSIWVVTSKNRNNSVWINLNSKPNGKLSFDLLIQIHMLTDFPFSYKIFCVIKVFLTTFESYIWICKFALPSSEFRSLFDSAHTRHSEVFSTTLFEQHLFLHVTLRCLIRGFAKGGAPHTISFRFRLQCSGNISMPPNWHILPFLAVSMTRRGI